MGRIRDGVIELEGREAGGARTVLGDADPDGVDGRVGAAPDLQRHLPRLAAAHDGLVEAAVERHAEHVVRGHLLRRRVVEEGQALTLPIHTQPPLQPIIISANETKQELTDRKGNPSPAGSRRLSEEKDGPWPWRMTHGGGREAVAGLPVHRRQPELELCPRRQGHPEGSHVQHASVSSCKMSI